MGCASSSTAAAESAKEAATEMKGNGPQPEALSRLKEAEATSLAKKDSFQEEIPSELIPGNSFNLPFFRLPGDNSNLVPNETFLNFLALLEVRKDEPHKTSHRSLYGHVKVCRLMMEGLKLEFLSQEKAFDLGPDPNDPFRPDLVFRWRRRERDLIVVCEVQQPLNDRPKAISANHLGKRTFPQITRGVELFGDEFCLGLGFVQKKHEKQLVAVDSCGKYGLELLKLIEKHGRKWQILVANAT